MENTYRELRTDTELLAAALMQAHVYVVETSPYDPDEMVDYSGSVEAYSPASVRIGGVWYLRKHHSFRINT